MKKVFFPLVKKENKTPSSHINTSERSPKVVPSTTSTSVQINNEKNGRWGGLFRRRSVNLNMSGQPNHNGDAKIFIPEEFKYEARNFSLDMKGNALFSYWAQGILILTAGVVLVFTSSLNQNNLIGNNAALIKKKVSSPSNMYIWNGTLSAALAVVMGIFSFFQTIAYSVLSRRILKVIDQNPNSSKPQSFSLMKKIKFKGIPNEIHSEKSILSFKERYDHKHHWIVFCPYQRRTIRG